MRIKLNLSQLTPDRNPAVYWLHIDRTCITLIKQLKEKVQKVLKESRDIELCFDNVPFLDEDDINAINENEEIAVILKKKNTCDDPKYIQTESNTIELDTEFDMIPANTNGDLSPCCKMIRLNKKLNSTKQITSSIDNGISSSYCEVDEEPNNDNENSTSSELLKKIPKKRIRKRTHKKKKNNELVENEPVENNYVGTLSETSIISSKETSKLHKRFKLDNGENNLEEGYSPSINSEEPNLHVTREVFRCDSPALNSNEETNISLPVWKYEKPLNIKFNKVPVFVRGQTCTPKASTENSSYIENENDKSNDSIISENCDMLVVDWKNMTQIKIANITELQIYDLLQFKIMSMNECGEPQLSSVITARLDHIYIELDDFACEPHSVPVSAVVVVTEGDNATVSCRMYGVPIPSSRWTRNDRPLSQTGHSVPVTEGRYTNLTIVSVVAQDGGSYACELENRSGSSRSNVTVVVVKRSPQLVLGADRYALPGLIVGVILVLSFCLIFLCGLAIRSKGSPTGSRGVPVSGPLDSAVANIDADPFDRYEKIEMDRDDNNKSMQHRMHQFPASSSDMNGRPDPPGYAESAATSSGLLHHRHDEHEDYDGLPPIDEPPSSTAPSITDRPTARPSHPTTNVPHRPRILPDDPKDGKKKTYLECNLGEVTLHHHVLHKESLPAGHLYTTAAGRQELFNTKNVPDLLDTLVPTKGRRISQTLPRSGISSNSRRNTVYTPRPSESQSPLLLGSRSSGGSNTSRSQLSFDSSISSDHPRQLTAGQKSSSYLNLSTASCGGGGDYSGGSSGGYHHQHHPSYYWTPPSLPSSPARERRLPAIPVGRGAGLPTAAAETPILDPLSSRRRTYSGTGGGGGHHYHNHSNGGSGNQMHNQLTGSNHSLLSMSDGASVTYDYHTAQLDMFLDEYKTLRKELTKMQRTCDTLRLSNASLASSVAAPDAVDHRSKPEPLAAPAASSSSSSRTTPKSILKNKNQATYVYRPVGERRNSYHQLNPAPDDIYLS